MKKQLFLFLTLGLFVLGSCSSDDDGGENEASIVATWTLASMNPPLLTNSCSQKPTITFNEDGTTSWTLYDPENDCTSVTSEGEWSNPSGSTYVVTIPDFGEVTGTATFNGQDKFTFNTSVNYQGTAIPVVLNFEK